MTHYSVNLPTIAHADVVVVGAGSAGSTAAIAAARLGAETLLIERYGFLGGTSTMVLDTFYGFYMPGDDSQRVVGGIAWEVVEQLRASGMLIERPSSYGAGMALTYDPATLLLVWDRLVQAAGVHLLLHTMVVDLLRDDSQRVTGLVVANKQGLGLVEARVVVDCSGDADVCVRAGAPYERAGDDGPAQALTTTFRLGGVDETLARQVKRSDLVARMRVANEQGYTLPREEGSIHRTPIPGLAVANMTRVSLADATDPFALSAAELEGRAQALEYTRFLRDQVAGYANAYLLNFSTQIGIRETRRVYGEYRLTREDVLAARSFPDAIARCGAPIEDHHGSVTHWEYLPAGSTYAIPLRCLIPQQLPNVLVAGRCLSATHDAHASVRSMGQCMAMGQAAGTAAAFAARSDGAVRSVAVAPLQHQLRRDGALL